LRHRVKFLAYPLGVFVDKITDEIGYVINAVLRGGTGIGKILRRYQRSRRKRPESTSFCRSLLVAAMTVRLSLSLCSLHSFKLSTLEHAEQFCWSSREAPDFIEKEVVPLAVSKRPILLAWAPVKAPSHDEEFAFDERRCKGSTIYLHERRSLRGLPL